MNDFSYEILDLLTKYEGDIGAALAGETSPQCLYAFSPLRENLLEWIELCPDARVLQVASDYGSYTGILLSRAKEVVVLDPRDENLEVNRLRHGSHDGLTLVRGDLTADMREAQEAARKMTEECGDGAVSVLVRNGESYGLYKPGKDETRTAKEILYQGFDYVILGGALSHEKKEEVSGLLLAAANLLKPGGQLVLAAENELGIRYLKGAKAFGTAFLESEFRGLLEELKRSMGGTYQIYYPVPDYRYPMAVYSDRHLPEVGDVKNISARYDGPGLWFGSEEEAMAKICQNGDFAKFNNSFLGIWEKGSL